MTILRRCEYYQPCVVVPVANTINHVWLSQLPLATSSNHRSVCTCILYLPTVQRSSSCPARSAATAVRAAMVQSKIAESDFDAQLT